MHYPSKITALNNTLRTLRLAKVDAVGLLMMIVRIHNQIIVHEFIIMHRGY